MAGLAHTWVLYWTSVHALSQIKDLISRYIVTALYTAVRFAVSNRRKVWQPGSNIWQGNMPSSLGPQELASQVGSINYSLALMAKSAWPTNVQYVTAWQHRLDLEPDKAPGASEGLLEPGGAFYRSLVSSPKLLVQWSVGVVLPRAQCLDIPVHSALFNIQCTVQWSSAVLFSAVDTTYNCMLPGAFCTALQCF